MRHFHTYRMNLAYQELYLVLAGIFRKYSLQSDTFNTLPPSSSIAPTLALCDTIRERDVDLVADMVVPAPALGSKGVRVSVM